DETRSRDVACEMPAGADANGAITATVEHEGRSGYSVQKMPHICITQCLEYTLDGSRARRGPEQTCPPGSRPRIASQARPARLDAGRPTPRCYELLQPHFVLAGLQRVRIVGRCASLRQRGEQNEAGDTLGMICGKLDACRSALGRAEQHDPAAAHGVKHGANV